MANIIEVLSKYDGVARAKHIAAAGVSDFQLKSAMAAGAVSRVARGVYALPGADAQLISIRSLPAEPACVTAAHFGGLWVLESPAQPHVALTHSRSYQGFVCHRSSTPPMLLDTVVQCLRCLPEPDGLIIAESAVVLKGLEHGLLAPAVRRQERRSGTPDRVGDRPAVAVGDRVPGTVSSAACWLPCRITGQRSGHGSSGSDGRWPSRHRDRRGRVPHGQDELRGRPAALERHNAHGESRH